MQSRAALTKTPLFFSNIQPFHSSPFFSQIVCSPTLPFSLSISLSCTMHPNTSMLPHSPWPLARGVCLLFFLLAIYPCGLYHFYSPFHTPDSAVKVPKIWSGPSKLFSAVGCGWMGGTEQRSSTKFSNGEEDGKSWQHSYV